MIDEPVQRLDEGALRALVPRVLAGLVRRAERCGADAALTDRRDHLPGWWGRRTRAAVAVVPKHLRCQRILAPYTVSTVIVISTLRSDTMTDRYSSQSGCSPAAKR
jgi:hypothetical protein